MPRGHLAATAAAVAAFLFAPSVAAAADFPLVGWWPMNEGSGQVVRDWSGKGNTGQLGSTPGVDSNDPSWIKGIFFGSGLNFDGNDYVSIPDSPSLEPEKITVAGWIRRSGTPGELKYIVSKGNFRCDHSSYGLYTSGNGGLAFYIADASAWYRSPEAPPSIWDGRWHHAAGTFDGTTVRLFIDGVEVGSGTPAATTISYDLPGGGLIGAYEGSCDEYNSMLLQGDVDGVQIWSTALPIDDIWRTLKALFTLAK